MIEKCFEVLLRHYVIYNLIFGKSIYIFKKKITSNEVFIRVSDSEMRLISMTLNITLNYLNSKRELKLSQTSSLIEAP